MDDQGVESFLYSMDDDTPHGGGVNVDSMPNPQQYAQVKFTLRPPADGSKSPVLRSWTLKSLPVVRRQRLIRYPLVCSDFHTDVNGVEVGVAGGAVTALLALEEAESANALLLVQDFRLGETFPASIEAVEFEGVDPPSRLDSSLRGVLFVTCRKL